jgi:hypothetical protein
MEGSLSAEIVLQDKLDLLAKASHDSYCRQRKRDGVDLSDPALREWRLLAEDLRNSNRQQADHIEVKLRAIGYRRSAAGQSAEAQPSFTFTAPQVEVLARMEHARWCAERFLANWQLGAKADKPNRMTPWLVAYDALPEEIKEYDRQSVRLIPDLLQLAGETIVPAAVEQARL